MVLVLGFLVGFFAGCSADLFPALLLRVLSAMLLLLAPPESAQQDLHGRQFVKEYSCTL